MMNDPEGDLASLPPLYVDGAGGQAGDPFAFVPGFDDNAGAGYANAGAAMTATTAINMTLSDPGYIAGATALNNSDLATADADGIQLLAQASTHIDWSKIATPQQQPDITHGMIELFNSAGVACAGAVSTSASCIYDAAKVAMSPGNPEVKGGISAFQALQCGLEV